ncbi:MAG: DUF2085 domain-containing protein [Chloroflexota bacterium]|nr:DUF2085 domain-containing protein [Chloroflexota bacterium]
MATAAGHAGAHHARGLPHPPWSLHEKLLAAMGGVCVLRPSHSYFAGGIQLPLEARMTGIYGGFTLATVLLLAFRRAGARRIGSTIVISTLGLAFSAMAFDGINSTLAEIGLTHLYTPTNALRLATGLLSGMALAPVILWLVSTVAAPRTRGTGLPVIRSPWELIVAAGVSALFAAFVVSEHPLSYYPVAVISVAGVVGVATSVALLLVVLVGGLDGRVTSWRQLVAPGGVALLLALGLLAGAATVRWTSLDGVLGGSV